MLGNVCRTIIEWSSEEAQRDKQKINEFLRKAYGLGCVNLEIIPCANNSCNQSSKIQGIISSCIDDKVEEIKSCLHKQLLEGFNEDCDDSLPPIPPLPPTPPNPPPVTKYYGNSRGCC